MLGLSAALATVATQGRLASGLLGEFALYGALHAAAVAPCLDGGASSSPARRVLLIAAGALLAALTARCGLLGLHAAAGAVPVATAMLAAVTGIGALAYGAAIRVIARCPLTPGALVAIALGCAAATAAAFLAARRWHLVGALWLVIPWWLAFSGGLAAAAMGGDGAAPQGQNR